ncbi:MAG TPA: hypothetical protein VE684_11760, partial [Crenalkalicoccus sp.]|nr:hypothetical protein [Crenalkalicoccus sp.]
ARPTPTPAPPHNSTTDQPNPTRDPAPDSRALENTLERLRALQPQVRPPTTAYNPPRGGAIGGGSLTGVDNARLSAAQRGAIGDRIRECWTKDAGALRIEEQSARLLITTDAGGVVRDAQILQVGPGFVGRAFAERARRAALDAQCNPLPLPRQMLGSVHTFEITFKP